MLPLRRKGKLMTAYLEYLLEALSSTQSNSKRDTRLRCVSPRHPDQRGSTLSVLFEAVTDNQSNGLVLDSSKYSKTLEQVISRLKERNVLVDSRAPSLIRFAPAPLYNTYQEVWKLAHFVVESLEAETM
jgi:kynureninase